MDRTVKALLALIAVALWGLLLRPWLALPAAQAAPPSTSGVPAITAVGNSNQALVVQNGRVYSVELYPRLKVTYSVPLR